MTVALADERAICRKAKPVEFLEDARFVRGTAPLTIVILDPQQDTGMRT